MSDEALVRLHDQSGRVHGIRVKAGESIDIRITGTGAGQLVHVERSAADDAPMKRGPRIRIPDTWNVLDR
jgi:hypothetical protein